MKRTPFSGKLVAPPSIAKNLGVSNSKSSPGELELKAPESTTQEQGESMPSAKTNTLMRFQPPNSGRETRDSLCWTAQA